jgi:hypothetical protein
MKIWKFSATGIGAFLNLSKAAPLVAVVLFGIIWVAPNASATAIDLGTAANYGLLVGQKESVTLSGGFNLAGDFGVGQGATVRFSGSNNIAGTEFKDSGVKTTGSASISGGVVTASMAQAIADATSAATDAAALSATPGLAYQNSSISVSGGSITIKALTNLSENVLNISSLSLLNGTITFDDNGYTDAKFIINVTGGFSISSTGSSNSTIQGINGATAADVLFNVEGTGSTVSITGNSGNQIIGTILAPQRNVTAQGGGSLVGAIIAGVGNAGKTYTLKSNSSGFNLSELVYKPSQGGGGIVPEPPTLALFAASAATILALGQRRRGIQKRRLPGAASGRFRGISAN